MKPVTKDISNINFGEDLWPSSDALTDKIEDPGSLLIIKKFGFLNYSMSKGFEKSLYKSFGSAN